MDVMDSKSIRLAIQWTIDKYRKIDVLVNNAGFAVYGPFEATNQAQAARQFNTNVFGLMEVTRELLPHFRQQKGGVLINVTSMGGGLVFRSTQSITAPSGRSRDFLKRCNMS